MTKPLSEALERVVWYEPRTVWMVDQTRLPAETRIIACPDLETLWEAIRMLRVRGAPAIGVAAAWGVALAADLAEADTSAGLVQAVRQACEYLATSRPTAVNLFWALDRMRAVTDDSAALPADRLRDRIRTEAAAIADENAATCEALSRHGAELIPDGAKVITHCNAGGLACANRYGTALGVLLAAHEQGKHLEVYVDETRPLLQGARLTAYELQRQGIPATLICDNMAAAIMRLKGITGVIFGADRITANGDTANKIGSYGLAMLAHAHGLPVYVAAPLSTVDFSLATGAEIPIEERGAEEITHHGGQRWAPEGIAVFNPAFDVTPAELITAIICEAGIARPPFRQSLAELHRQSCARPSR